MKTAIFAIALDEERYLAEWLQYHTLLGFDKFFIYDNSPNNVLSEFESDLVKIIHFPGKVQQIPAYNHFVSNFSQDLDYAIALDIDEFLVIHNDLSLADFIKKYLTSAGIAIHWKFFGSNGHLTYSDVPVLERFTKCQVGGDSHFKTLIDCRRVSSYANPHLPDSLVSGEILELSGEAVNSNQSNVDTTDIAQINHYFCKSWEEFNLKVKRGRSDISDVRILDDFTWSNINDVEDTRALDFIKRALSKI